MKINNQIIKILDVIEYLDKTEIQLIEKSVAAKLRVFNTQNTENSELNNEELDFIKNLFEHQ